MHIAVENRLRHSPVVLEQRARRAANFQLRIADWITGFAGSMNFVYIHTVLFTAWMLFIEHKPWPTLTLIVSLEAIFLSTVVRRSGWLTFSAVVLTIAGIMRVVGCDLGVRIPRG